MFCLSFVALTVKARLRGLDWSLEDAAADLGSPPLRTFVKITFPIIVPGVVAAFLLSLSLSIDDYIITSFIAGSVSTFPREIFDSAKVEIPPQVHVIATLIMVVAIVILVAGTLLGNRRRRQAVVSRRSRSSLVANHAETRGPSHRRRSRGGTRVGGRGGQRGRGPPRPARGGRGHHLGRPARPRVAGARRSSAAPKATWVQLPFAGIENFVHLVDHDHMWTCGKGVYAEPVAELALTLGWPGCAAWARTPGRSSGRRPRAATCSAHGSRSSAAAGSPSRSSACCSRGTAT